MTEPYKRDGVSGRLSAGGRHTAAGGGSGRETR